MGHVYQHKTNFWKVPSTLPIAEEKHNKNWHCKGLAYIHCDRFISFRKFFSPISNTVDKPTKIDENYPSTNNFMRSTQANFWQSVE